MKKCYDGLNGENLLYLEEWYKRTSYDSFEDFLDSIGNIEEFSHSSHSSHSSSGNRDQMIDFIRSHGHRYSFHNPLSLKVEIPSQELLDDNGTSIFLHKLSPDDRDLYVKLSSLYMRECAFFYSHIASFEERSWISSYIEQDLFFQDHDYYSILEQLVKATCFESFLDKRFPGAKRFGLEGCESLIYGLFYFLNKISPSIDEVVFGMAHRGRLNILANILLQDLKVIFSSFLDSKAVFPPHCTGDVKYHLGAQSVYYYEKNCLRLTLMNNPSHLEAVNSVTQGFVRAKADHGAQVVPVLIHGDSAFLGQGCVYESFNYCSLPGYDCGGSIHIILNNQIGFTTVPEDYTSLREDAIARLADIPMISVNVYYPGSIGDALFFAYSYRRRFSKDVIIELCGFRKNGHNESDNPCFTQPVMYNTISSLPSILNHYVNLKGCRKEYLVLQKQYTDLLDSALEKVTCSKSVKIPLCCMPIERKERLEKRGHTVNQFDSMIRKLLSLPSDVKVHAKLKKIFQKRFDLYSKDGLVDWSLAEMLACASVLDEGFLVRFSGQDSIRGTFSHRHFVVYDQETGEHYNIFSPFCNKGTFFVYNSPLSEESVLGYEYGYSLYDLSSLVIWEAQFGDFVNGAQVVIDQFISSAQTKWNQVSNLVLLLPHGYEGQGPEHSSARLERFLQLCSGNNMIIVNCTTPSNYFHALRSQVCRRNLGPLVVMSPKSLLRHPDVISHISEFSSSFRPILYDPVFLKNKQSKINVVFCSGRIFFDLPKDINALVIRVEQLYPFPIYELNEIASLLEGCISSISWIQEEPFNQGAWSFVCVQLRTIFQFVHRDEIQYFGRSSFSSTAEGLSTSHSAENRSILHRLSKFLKGD